MITQAMTQTTPIGSTDPRDVTITRLREGLDQVIEENNRQHRRIEELETLLTRVLRAEMDG